jgi:hypothetical protein
VNGDGTATDYDTGLVWEQKTDDGSVHDKDNRYSWCPGGAPPNPTCNNPSNPPDGTAFTAFLGTLNNGTSSDGTVDQRVFRGPLRLAAAGHRGAGGDRALACAGGQHGI